jgi:tetrahydrodipicolinate N-succinyltransferase
MPWRLIGFVLIGAVFLCFIGFNLENRCDISFGVFIFRQVPVFLTAFSAFVLGMLLALPLVIPFRGRGRRGKKAETGQLSGTKKGEALKTADAGGPVDSPPPDNDYGIR